MKNNKNTKKNQMNKKKMKKIMEKWPKDIEKRWGVGGERKAIQSEY